MNLLNKLAQISDNAELRRKMEEDELSEAQRNEELFILSVAMDGLSERLVQAARKEPEKRKYVVFNTRGYSSMDERLYTLSKSSGNMYCAWRDKVITEKDILVYMKGAFRKIYEACEKMDLQPKVGYWWDGAENDGFEIYITW